MHAKARRFGILRIVTTATAAGITVAALASLGGGSASARPATAPVAAPVAALSADPPLTRGWCVKVGNGDLRNLWLTRIVDGKRVCPIYTPISDEYWGPVTFGGTPGPVGPQGPAGDSRIVMVSGTATTAAGTAGNGPLVVHVAGLPAYSSTQAHRTFVDVDAELLAGGVTASVGAPTASPGSTTWSYPVTVAGQTVATPGQTVRIDVLAVPVG